MKCGHGFISTRCLTWPQLVPVKAIPYLTPSYSSPHSSRAAALHRHWSGYNDPLGEGNEALNCDGKMAPR